MHRWQNNESRDISQKVTLKAANTMTKWWDPEQNPEGHQMGRQRTSSPIGRTETT